MKLWHKIILFIAAAAVLTRFAPFSQFFRSVNTLFHELGHAAVTLLLSGHVQHIYLYEDLSGVTSSSVFGPWRVILVALAGYSLSALTAPTMFFIYAKGKEKTGLLFLAFLTLTGLLLFVRNSYGVVWCIGFAAVSLVGALLPWNWLRRAIWLLISFIVLVESVWSSLTISLLGITDPARAGDAAILSRTTGVPAAAWGIGFTVIALWSAKVSMKLLFASLRKGKAPSRSRMNRPFHY
jgi:hypothetical protein